MTDTSVDARAADVARAAYGRLLAMLASRSGDIISAEDALSDAFVAALSTWPERGIPENPEAWLLAVAKNRRIDRVRKDAPLMLTDEIPEMPDTSQTDENSTVDHRLKLMFVCAHPAIDQKMRTPLMLQTVLGLEARDIANAFLIAPDTMAQRLVRVKRKIKLSGIPFVVPDTEVFPDRMDAVLEAIYGAFALDWLDGAGDLAHEALFLSSVLSHLAPKTPEVLGLTALIGFVEARRAARIRDGALVPVPEQNTALWDSDLIDHSANLLTRASALGVMGRFQLEAAIQSVHAARAVTGRTDWRALAQLYTGLVKIHPTIGSAVSQAAAVAHDVGPQQGLALLDKIEPDAVATYQPAHAVRAHCLADLGRYSDAAISYTKAIELSRNTPSKRWLENKRHALRN